MTKYVALICRLSPRPDGSYEGVELQEKWGREYAARTWPGVPVEVFADKGLSAANGDHRPQFERFREWVAAGRIAHVWAVEQTRVERREVEWFLLAAELDNAGVTELHTNRDGIVRVRDAVAGIKAVLAADEVRKLKKRVKDRLAENAALGRPAGSIHYAHRRVVDKDGNKTVELIPERQKMCQEAAERALAGWGLFTITADLYARGFRGARGGRISPNGLKAMLISPSAAGHRAHGGRIVKRNAFPPVLHDDPKQAEIIWQAVTAKLSQPRRVRRADGTEVEITEKFYGRSTTRRYLLTGGVTVCGPCRARLAGTIRTLRGQGRVSYMDCHPRMGGKSCVGIRMDAVEEFVLDKLWAELDKPEFLDQLSINDNAARRDAIGDELTALEGRRRTLAEQWGAGQLTDIEWQAARQGIAEAERELREELAAFPTPVIGVDIAQARKAWPDMTLEEQREFLTLFIDHVVIAKGRRGMKFVDTSRITIEWKHR